MKPTAHTTPPLEYLRQLLANTTPGPFTAELRNVYVDDGEDECGPLVATLHGLPHVAADNARAIAALLSVGPELLACTYRRSVALPQAQYTVCPYCGGIEAHAPRCRVSLLEHAIGRWRG